MSQNEKRALLSVRKLKPNDYAITKAALEAPLASVRTAAIDRLANADDLMHFIRVTHQWEDKRRALSRLFQTKPLSSAWDALEDMDRDAVLRDKPLQNCLECVALHDKPDAARRAVSYIGDQKYLRFLYEENPQVRLEALSRITDQNILQDLLAKAPHDEARAPIMAVMRDPAPARALARSTENPTVCVTIIQRIADKALALEIMAQTLNKKVCTACAALVDIHDVTDARRLAILALCGPESVRQEAGSRLVDEEAYVGVALHEDVSRFPIHMSLNEHKDCLCHDAIKHLSDAAKQRLRLVRSPWEVKQWTEELRQWTDAAYLLDMIALCPKHYCTSAVCARLDALDEGWVQKLDDRTVEAMIDIISSNSAEEKFDLAHIASVLKQVYRQGRAEAAIASLRGRTVAHDDASSMERRDRNCHEDRGYTYFELD
jgi:hypothetical protein